jgi:hypothetical protein
MIAGAASLLRVAQAGLRETTLRTRSGPSGECPITVQFLRLGKGGAQARAPSSWRIFSEPSES